MKLSLFLTGFGPFYLKNHSSYVIKVLIFAETEESLLERISLVKNIYKSDYGQTGFLTFTEGQVEIPTNFSFSNCQPVQSKYNHPV